MIAHNSLVSAVCPDLPSPLHSVDNVSKFYFSPTNWVTKLSDYLKISALPVTSKVYVVHQNRFTTSGITQRLFTILKHSMKLNVMSDSD